MTPRTSPRRLYLSLLMLAMLLSIGGNVARAQALKQLPANPFVVIKFNNVEQLNQKIGALTQKLGLANIDPSFADPLGALKQSLNLNEAFNAKSDFAIAFRYAVPSEGLTCTAPLPTIVASGKKSASIAAET